MAFLCGRCPSLHLHPAPHAFLSHLSSVPRGPLVPTTSAIASYNTTSCNRRNFTYLQHENIEHAIKVKVSLLHTTHKPSSSFKYCAVLAVPLLSSFLLPSVATALGMDGLPSSPYHPIQSLPVADLDPSVASLLIRILGPVFSSLNFLFIIRIVMSWYPQLPVDKFPYVIAFAPTEPVLEPTRRLIPPVGGVDVSPVIWVALMSFLNEILLGQQGLLLLLSQQQA